MMNDHPVSPVDPVAPYLGGKRNLATRLVDIIHRTPHTSYAEVFTGMGGVFFRRRRRPQAEIINDYSRDVANLFRILQRHYPQFLDTIKWQLAGRAEFDRMMRENPESLTDLERAARFLYLQRLAFGGKVTGRSFGVAAERPSRFDLTKLVPMLEEVHDRLSGVVIECLDYKDFIAKYDGPNVLFYLDPPYYGCEGDYGAHLFNRDEFAAMAAQLAGLQGKFLLSLNDHPAVREIFAAFDIKTVETTYTIGQAGAKSVSEVIIANYKAVHQFEQAALL
jgi:DNA adenine methylase